VFGRGRGCVLLVIDLEVLIHPLFVSFTRAFTETREDVSARDGQRRLFFLFREFKKTSVFDESKKICGFSSVSLLYFACPITKPEGLF